MLLFLDIESISSLYTSIDNSQFSVYWWSYKYRSSGSAIIIIASNILEGDIKQP